MRTQRLLIRRFVADDWADLYEILSDERVVKYEPYPTLTESQCKEVALYRAGSDDFWAVCLDGGRLIGNVYLAEKEHSNWEIGYVFGYAYQNRGYATEAVSAVIEKVFREDGAHRIYANCNPENMPSWRLLERVGFQREGWLRKNIYFGCGKDGIPLWQDTLIYGLLKDEWSKANR